MITEFIDYLVSHFEIEYVSGGSQIKVSGQCPFCGEERGDLRLYVNVGTGKGICFHCGQGFGPIGFVKAVESCGKERAARILAGDDDAYLGERDRPDPVTSVVFPEMVPLLESIGACEYLEGRGVTLEMIEHFKLMYCKRNMRVGERGFYTKGRVIIPIHDIKGNPVSWQGRDITGRSSLRYLFPPGFKGAEHLYNAWSVPVGAHYIVISEGVFDVFGWWRAGYPWVVGTFGKKISEGQMDLINYLNPRVIYIAWDSDADWNKYEFMEKYSYKYTINFLDMDGKDSDELSPDELKNIVSGAKKYSWSDKILSGLR